MDLVMVGGRHRCLSRSNRWRICMVYRLRNRPSAVEKPVEKPVQDHIEDLVEQALRQR